MEKCVMNKQNVLPQLEYSIPDEIFGYSVSMYSLALEGWRRGLKLKFINNNRRKSEIDFSLSDKENEHFFQVVRGDAVPRSAIQICVNKDITKEYLLGAGVPTPFGQSFKEDTLNKEIIKFAESANFPLVIKPIDGTAGKGVIANIKNLEEFREALQYVRGDLNYKKVMVEQYISGEDYRLYVCDGKVIAILKKIPANVIGDGQHTIKYLLNEKNKERTKYPTLKNRPIIVDTETKNVLKSVGYTLDSVPKKGEQVFLKTKNNISSGGDPVDATDELPDRLKEIAVAAAEAIPGLVQCGVDMMVDESKQNGYVLELNSRPHITAQLYPMYGKARDIPKAIIDYYFPQTSQQDYLNAPTYFFEFQIIYDSFRKGICKEYIIPDIPKGKKQASKLTLKGNVQGVKLEQWTLKQARKLNLHGYIKNVQTGDTVVVISGKTENVSKFRLLLSEEPPKGAVIEDVREEKYQKPVKIGFEMVNPGMKAEPTTSKVSGDRLEKVAVENKTFAVEGYEPIYVDMSPVKPSKKKSTNSGRTNSTPRSSTKQDYSKVLKERNHYRKRLKAIENSRSWKVTAPIRRIGKKVKMAINGS